MVQWWESDALFHINDPVEDAGSEAETQEVKQFRVEGQWCREVGESKNCQSDHDEACEENEPLSSRAYQRPEES